MDSIRISPSANSLSIRLRPGGFSYRINDGEPHYVDVPHDAAQYHTVQEAIMERDELLDGFQTVSCQLDTMRFAVVPPDVTGQLAHSFYSLSLPEAEGEEVIERDDIILFGIAADFYHFMQRTFGDVRFTHPLAELKRAYGIGNKKRGERLEVRGERLEVRGERSPLGPTPQPLPVREGSKMQAAPSSYSEADPDEQTLSAPSLTGRAGGGSSGGEAFQLIAHVDFDSMNLILLREGTLQLANRYETADLQNMAYFLMNTWRQCGLDALRDNLTLTGDPSMAARLRVLIAPLVKRLSVQTFAAQPQ